MKRFKERKKAYDKIKDYQSVLMPLDAFYKEIRKAEKNFEFELAPENEILDAIRKEFKLFRRAEYDEVKFITVHDNDFALGYEVKHEDENFVVLFNAHPLKEVVCELPKGKWEVLVNQNKAGTKSIESVSGIITIPTSSGFVLKKK